MIQVNDLKITIEKNLRVLVDGLSFVLHDGDKAALIGEEGNGKSTILKALADEALIASYASCEGRISLGGHIGGYVAQELTDRELSMPICDYMQKNCGDLLEPESAAMAAAQVGLTPQIFDETRPLRSCSGGEKVKLQIAAVLVRGADWLLLDEPTNDLDLETLEWFERFLCTYPGPVLYISHDETLLEQTANVIIHIEQVRKKTLARHTVKRSGYRAYADQRLALLAHQEQVARKEAADYEQKMRRWDEIYRKVETAQRNISRADPGGARLLKKKMKSVLAQERRFEREKEHQTQLPDVEDAIFLDFSEKISLPAGKTVLDYSLDELIVGGRLLSRGIRLHLNGGEHAAIVGLNGCGKTTLLRKIAEELLARRDLSAAYMPQDYAERLDFSQTPVDFLAPSGRKDDITAARSHLGSVRFTRDEMCARIGELSGGQKAKLIFLKMVLEGSDVLILDEPTRNLSPMSAPVIREILKHYRGTILCVTHDRKLLAEVFPTVYRLTSDGLIAERT